MPDVRLSKADGSKAVVVSVAKYQSNLIYTAMV